MSALRIRQISCHEDNYAVLLHDPRSGETLLVDAPEAAPVNAVLEAEGWRLTKILNTHHHYDHVEANEALKAAWGARVCGPAHDRARIPGLDVPLKDGDRVSLGNFRIDVIATPGHTLGSVSYYVCGARILLAGDTLFSLGCGRMFEGDAETMWRSLDLLRHLPDETRLYCGHEYTLANAEFALSVEPDNAALQERARQARELRRRGEPTLPSTIAKEKAANPFLRPESMEIRENLGLKAVENWRVFAELRQRKDAF